MLVPRLILTSFLVASGSRVRVHDAVATSSLPEDWAEKTAYVCMQKWKEGSRAFENKYCLVQYNEDLQGEHVQYAIDINLCAKWQTMKVCDLKGGPDDLRLSYSSKKAVAKACFRSKDSSESFAMIEAAVDASTCEETTGGEIGEALTTTTTTIAPPTTTTTTTTTTTEELDEEVEKTNTVNALSLFTEEGYWELGDKKIKCCVSSVGYPARLQDLNAEELPSYGKVRLLGDKTGCGYMFGDTFHNGLQPFGARTETRCDVRVGEIMKASGLEFGVVLDMKLPEAVPHKLPEVLGLLQVASDTVPGGAPGANGGTGR